MATDWIELEFLTNKLNGVSRVLCEGESPLLAHIVGPGQAIRESLCGVPLLLDVRLDAAPQSQYLLWACWLSPDTDLQPHFAPLNQWRMSLSPPRRALPVLMLARAQGRFDIPPVWDPKFAALLDERNPIATMDGRLLLLASPAGPQPWYPGEALTQALSHYVASLLPGTKQLLPSGCFLVRSGPGTLSINTNPRIRVFAARVSAKTNGTPRSPSRNAVPLPPGLTLECQLKGNLLWGAWRGDGVHNLDAVRFVSTTSQAHRATSVKFRIQCSMSAADQHAFTDALPGASIPLAQATIPTAAGQPGDASNTLISLISRKLLQSVETDGRLARIIKMPYLVVHQEVLPAALSIEEAAAFPYLGKLPDGGQGPAESIVQRQEIAEFVSFLGLISQNRDIQMVLPSNLSMARNPPAVAGTKSAKSATGPSPSDPQTARRLQRAALLADLSAILACIRSVASGRPPEDTGPLAVSLQWTRSRPLLMAMLPEILERTNAVLPPPAPLRQSLDSADRVQCTLAAELPRGAVQSCITSGFSTASRETGLRSAAVAVQFTLRSFLALSVCTTEDACVDSVWTRALLVHRYARVWSPSDKTACVEDPRSDSVLMKTAHSAQQAIRSAAKLWYPLLRRADMPGRGQRATMFAQGLVARTIASPFQLRKILLEEQELCHHIVYFFVSQLPNRLSRLNQAKASQQDQRTAGLLLRAAERIYPGGAARELAPLLLLSAAGAITGAMGGLNLNYRLELRAVSEESTKAA